MPIEVIRVHKPSEEQFSRIIDVCLRAFSNDTVVQSMAGNDPGISLEGTRAIYMAGLLEGSVLIAIDSDDKEQTPMGVALGFGPGKGLYVTEAQRSLGYDRLWASYPEDLKMWWTDEFLPKSRKLKEDAVGTNCIFQAWYVDNVTTDPTHQGKGVGTALVAACCARAKEDGVPLYLNAMTEYNVAWYKKQGFVEKGTMEFSALGGEPCKSTLLVWGDSSY